MSTDTAAAAPAQNETRQQSLATVARNLATTTKTPPQMQGITSRWPPTRQRMRPAHAHAGALRPVPILSEILAEIP